jgi:hypothetical protein
MFLSLFEAGGEKGCRAAGKSRSAGCQIFRQRPEGEKILMLFPKVSNINKRKRVLKGEDFPLKDFLWFLQKRYPRKAAHPLTFHYIH